MYDVTLISYAIDVEWMGHCGTYEIGLLYQAMGIAAAILCIWFKITFKFREIPHVASLV